MEVGSEFHLVMDKKNDRLSHFDDALLFGFARGLINNIIKQLKEQGITKFLIPNYLCESVLTPFLINNVEIEYYKINKDLTIDLDDFSNKYTKCQAVYIINYFNIDNEILIRSKFDLSNLISVIDVTHNLFSTKMIESDIYVASLRKWIGIPSGAYLKVNKPSIITTTNISVNNQQIDEIIYKRLYAASLKKSYLLNRRKELKSNFLKIFNESEEMLDKYGYNLTHIDVLSKSILTSTNWSEIFKKRRSNFSYLARNLRNLVGISVLCEIDDQKVPIGFPIFAHRRDGLREYLTNNKVYCPIHWPIPKNISLKSDIVENINSHILTLPCDQRYSIEDMEKIVALIQKFIGEHRND